MLVVEAYRQLTRLGDTLQTVVPEAEGRLGLDLEPRCTAIEVIVNHFEPTVEP